MTYKDTIINCMKNYPTLYPNRLNVDNHLFAVIGNGYEWKGGQIVEDVYSSERNEDDEYENLSKAEYSSLFTANDYEMYVERFNNYNPNVNRIFHKMIDGKSEEEINDLITSKLNEPYKMDSRLKWHVYPLCDYSKIVNIPDNIQDDWLDAIEHFVCWCLNNQEYLYDEHYDNINDYTKANANNRLNILKKVQTRINEIKKIEK